MILLTHPTNTNHGNGGVTLLSVSTQLKFKVALSVVATENRLIPNSHAVEKEFQEMVKAEEDNR